MDVHIQCVEEVTAVCIAAVIIVHMYSVIFFSKSAGLVVLVGLFMGLPWKKLEIGDWRLGEAPAGGEGSSGQEGHSN